MSDPLAEELDRVCTATGFSRNPFWKTWAKVELFLGLSASAAGFVFVVHGPDFLTIASGAGLLVLGGYLTLAGHRSHLYHSNNRLTAYLATTVRQSHSPGNHP